MTQENKRSIGTNIKLYLFPSLVTILAMMIWRDVSELRSDVKALLAQSNIDKTKIESLEKDVRMLEQKLYDRNPTSLLFDKYFKHEEIFDIKKYLNKSEDES